MALDASVLAELRSYVGTATPDDDDLETRYERLGTVGLVALEVLRQRRADILANPTKYKIGEDTVDNTDRLKLLNENIDLLEAGQGFGIGYLARTDRPR